MRKNGKAELMENFTFAKKLRQQKKVLGKSISPEYLFVSSEKSKLKVNIKR